MSTLYTQLIRDRIKELIVREGGGSLNSMRWNFVAEYVCRFSGKYINEKQFRKDVKTMTANDVDNLELTDAQWVGLFEVVVRQANNQM